MGGCGPSSGCGPPVGGVHPVGGCGPPSLLQWLVVWKHISESWAPSILVWL